jgi:hypothetical protein
MYKSIAFQQGIDHKIFIGKKENNRFSTILEKIIIILAMVNLLGSFMAY